MSKKTPDIIHEENVAHVKGGYGYCSHRDYSDMFSYRTSTSNFPDEEDYYGMTTDDIVDQQNMLEAREEREARRFELEREEKLFGESDFKMWEIVSAYNNSNECWIDGIISDINDEFSMRFYTIEPFTDHVPFTTGKVKIQNFNGLTDSTNNQDVSDQEEVFEIQS